ncbi:MAG: carboxy terminal-processing peptidase [Immundisolibacterales bacterium]|nr:carboxy terminal-processing peptidase [Immundisolibacterales bacterium]
MAAALVVAVASSPDAYSAQGDSSPAEELRPSAAHVRSARVVVELMSRYHYRKVPLDDALGSTVLDRYLDIFDPGHSVFLASDVEEFDDHRTKVDDALRSGRLGIAFEVFDRYRTRMAERAGTASALAGRDFDFARDEHLELDRSDAPWATSLADLDDYWRRRVKNDILELELAGHELEEIPEALKARYSRMARRARQINADDVVQFFLNAYTQSIDPHSSYFSPRSSENFRIRMSLSLEGIGAALQTVGEHTVVRRIIVGGPADRSGQLGVDDRIIGVRQADEEEMTDVVSWRIEDVVNLIRGPKGSTVHLQILPAENPSGPPRTLALVRDRIDLDDQSASSRILETRASDGAAARVGIIDIPSFYLDIAGRSAGRDDYRSTSRDVRRLIEELSGDGIDGIVVDLRDNQGGSLDEALLVAGLFIDSGPIVQIRKPSGGARVRWDKDPSVAWDGPLGILVNRSSASASEILAGAIQDYGRGLVIGTRTYGKGTVQNLVDLPAYGGTGRLKLTISEYFRVNGAGVQRRGIEPDVNFAPVTTEAGGGEGELDNALPWAKINAVARWRAKPRNDEALAAARDLSRERLQAGGPAHVLREEIEERRRWRESGAVSLNRARREAEHAELEAQRLRIAKALSRAIEEGNGEERPAEVEELPDLRDEFFLAEAARVIADFASYRPGHARASAAN